MFNSSYRNPPADLADPGQDLGSSFRNGVIIARSQPLLFDEIAANPHRGDPGFEPGGKAFTRIAHTTSRHNACPRARTQNGFNELGPAHGIAGEDFDDLHPQLFSFCNFRGTTATRTI